MCFLLTVMSANSFCSFLKVVFYLSVYHLKQISYHWFGLAEFYAGCPYWHNPVFYQGLGPEQRKPDPGPLVAALVGSSIEGLVQAYAAPLGIEPLFTMGQSYMQP